MRGKERFDPQRREEETFQENRIAYTKTQRPKRARHV